MPLPASFVCRLQAFTTAAYWNSESKVNGLWTSMLASTATQGLNVGNLLIRPKSIPPGIRQLRPDLNLLSITNANWLGLERFVYEGRSAVSTDGWDEIDTQLNDCFTDQDLKSQAWAIGAKDHEFKFRISKRATGRLKTDCRRWNRSIS